MTDMSMNAIPPHEYSDVVGLHWIARFGWLRYRELGALMWPTPHSKAGQPLHGSHEETVQRKAAHRIAQRWAENRWIIHRKLAKQGGTAVVLSSRGARFLQSRLGTNIRSGENWGRSSGGVWSPPKSWEHELLAAVLLIRFSGRGFQIKTELEIREENVGQRKFPDGLVLYQPKDPKAEPAIYWLEIESAEKAGRKMLALASTVTRVNRRTAPCLSGWCATNAMVAFRSDHLDLAGRPIDHKRRIVSALSKHIGACVDVTFAELQIKNSVYHLGDIELSEETISPVSADPGDSTFAQRGFHSNAAGTYERDCIDRKGDPWVLKVARSHDRYSWEIWDSEKMRASFHIERLEDAFHVVVERWLRDFF